jgi:accessory colonization factor AcfC
MTDYLTPPEVLAVETGAYDGAVGDPIVVRAVDDVAVAEVRVTLRDGAGAVLEQGVATAATGIWTYAATTVVAAGTVVAVEAVATDRPGNTGRKTVTDTLP